MADANFTDTILVPSDQDVTATSQTGAMATWTTPAALPGATPGSCTPASGSTFPIFSSTVTCQVFDATGDEATGTFEVNVVPTTQYFSRVLVPSNGATLSGANYLDAEASDSPGVTKVVFELSGGSLSNQVVATATPTIYGWLAQWASATVPNGSYSLVSVATDADGNTDPSVPISIAVDNPMTSVLIPSAGATVSGTSTRLDASASSPPGIASVVFELSGGTLSDQVIAKGTATIYGWLNEWNTTTVANGSYTLQSVATDKDDAQVTSSPVSITVNNPAPTTTVLIPESGATVSGISSLLDASGSANVVKVTYELTGGDPFRPRDSHGHADDLRLAGRVEHDERLRRHLQPPERRHLQRRGQRDELIRHHHRPRLNRAGPRPRTLPGVRRCPGPIGVRWRRAADGIIKLCEMTCFGSSRPSPRRLHPDAWRRGGRT